MTKKKAIWWFFPSLLEPCDGPWGKLEDFGHDPVETWKAIIDWAAALRVDHLITGIEPYISDRVYNQWGFHYVCHFPDDPAARCFDADTIDRNIATIRRICTYGRDQGVGIMFHHYNLMAPERWVQAHPELAAKHAQISDPVWGRHFHNDRFGFLVSNVCWNSPLYRDFLNRCWQEVFANIPELAGAMITAGEFMFCGCDACTGGVAAHIFQGLESDDERAVAQKKLRDERRGRMIVELIGAFHQSLTQQGKEAIVRNWVVERWLDQMPAGVQYATKYSVFDACWGGPDPVIHTWLEAGHTMWETVAIEAENCGPVLWHHEQWCQATAQRLQDLDIAGTIIHINTQWGHTGHIASFTASRNITRLLERLAQRVPAGDSRQEFTHHFGPEAGPIICQAAQKLASFPLRMTEIIHLAKEGFSYGMPPWFDGQWRWPGALGSPRYQAPEWINPDGRHGIHDLLEKVRQQPHSYQQLIDSPGDSVLALATAVADTCSAACHQLETCPAPLTGPARSELRALIAGAHIAHQATLEHRAVLAARLAWEALKQLSTTEPEAAATARQTAITWYQQAIDALQRQLPRGLEIARIYPDQAHHVLASRETFNRLTMATRLRLRRQELELIRTVNGPDWEAQMTIDFWSQLPHGIGCAARPT